MPGGKIVEISSMKQKILELFQNFGNEGFRVLGVCYREKGI